MIKKVIVASKNPVKIKAALVTFLKMFPSEQFEVEGLSVASGVSDQPTSDQEVFQGAFNRADNAKLAAPDADFWVGMEGGVEEKDNEMQSFTWVVVVGKNNRVGKGRSGAFFLPQKVAALIRQGKELGEADDIVFGQSNSKQQNGAVGILTNNAIDRTSFYAGAVVLALIPFKNESLY